MVFSSLYLDPHNNWHHQAQQENQQQLINIIINENTQQLPPLRPPSPSPPTGSIGVGNTMADRARLAKIAQPETPLKCPRCDSTNTKFCYFNNYNLAQPRHFCKTCRRYWTKGGALRNVPVGGGCRRNKRNKRSKPPAATANRKASNSSCSTSSVLHSSSRGTDNNMLNHVFAAQSSQLPFLPSMHLLGGYGCSDIGLSFGGIQTTAAVAASNNGVSNFGFQSSNGMDQPTLSSGISEQWRLQQFPFMANLETSVTVPSRLQGVEPACYIGQTSHDHQLRASCKQLDNIDGITQLIPVKMEGNQRLSVSENFSGISENDQYWGGEGGGGGGNAWTHLSDFSSSSTRHLL